MSLDVTLKGPKRLSAFICPTCGRNALQEDAEELFTANITHNLNEMAEAAGIYKHLWRPEELDITKAQELIAPLTEGLRKLKATPDLFRKHNPANNWGRYEDLVRFVANYLVACEDHPDADVHACR